MIEATLPGHAAASECHGPLDNGPWPVHLARLQERAQLSSMARIDVLNPSYAAAQRIQKARMAFAILTFEAVAQSVREDGFQTFALGAGDARTMIGNEAKHSLTLGSAQDAGFAVVDEESFFDRDRANQGFEAPCES